MKILLLIPYPLLESPSQRFRFEQYISLLNKNGYACTFQSFLNSHNWQLFFSPGRYFLKFALLLNGYLRRTYILLMVPYFDLIFIHREAAPLGPPFFEWIISKLFRKRIIYDFDDAIWLTDRTNEPVWLKRAKWRRKTADVCRMSYKVSCGNDYLCAYARQYNSNVVFNPSTIDTERVHNPQHYTKLQKNKTIIGWTGSHSTLKYLVVLEPVLQSIENKYPNLEFWVIADIPPPLKLKRLNFRRWSLETEITDLTQFDIGIMPLPDDEWTKGKCGFKILQYMALQIPAIASPVGVNKKIIQSGVNGFLCDSLKEWEHRLTELIENEGLRNSIGIAARKSVVERYSVSSNANNFISLMK